MVSLLPEPAPAITANGASGALMTADCSGVGSSIPSSRASCAGLNRGGRSELAGGGSSFHVSWPVVSVTLASGAPLGDAFPRRSSLAPQSRRRRALAAHSWRHLTAALVYRAACRRRAAPAAVIGRRLELRAGHRRGGLFDERLGPARVRVVGQRTLALHGRRFGPGRLADVNQLGAARLGRTQLDEGAEQHGQLVHAELRVPLEIRGRRLR